MSLSSIVNEIAGTVTNNLNWVTDEASQQIAAVVEFASRNYSTMLEPAIQATVEKIQNFDLTAFASDAKTFVQSDFGISGTLLFGSVGCVVASRQVSNIMASVALILTGVGAAGVSAALFFNPELIRGAVRV